MARRQHHNSISLFPFLAVLVCAMGSLILLLLVMTRKIRQDQQNDTAVPVLAAEHQSPADLSEELTALEQQIIATEELLAERQALADSLAAGIGERIRQRDALSVELTELQQKLKSEKNSSDVGISESLKEARELKAREAALLRQLKEAEKQLFDKQQLLASASESSKEAELTLQEKHSALISLRKQVEKAKERASHVAGTSTLLEFSNPSGTVRTPIVIDVSEKGFVLLPNGLLITQADMEGFPVRDNPLLSAILTAHRHRAKGSVTDQPYVLLLVRPSGALPFYGAQRILMESKIHYGYELLEPDRQITVGESDDSEMPALQAAIGDAMKRRENLYARLMAIARQKSELEGMENAAGGNSSERRMSIRPDGRVVMNEGSSRRPLDGRFYAGGVAPPPSLLQNRPIGGYGARNKDALSPADAEKMAEEFAERYARQQTESPDRPPGAGSSQLPESSLGEDRSLQRSAAEQRFAESLFGAPSLPASEANAAPATSSAFRENPIAENAEPEFESFASSMASAKHGRRESQVPAVPVSPAESLLMTEASDGIPSTGSPDLSRVDPDLLARLNAGKKQAGSLSTPIGITVFIDEHHLTIGQQPAMTVDSNSLDLAFAELLTGIHTEVKDAQLRPDEPVMPIVKFVVSPGGERWRIPLAHSLKRTGIHSATVYELTPYMMTQDDTGRASLP